MLMYTKHMLTGWLLLILSASSAYPRQAQHDFSLRPGDRLPDLVTAPVMTPDGKMHPGKRLSDYRGKLLLLDFWATWCTACIANFPKIDSLRKSSGGKLEVLAVDSRSGTETPARVRAFFAGAASRGIRYNFTTVIGDTALTQLFPHRLIPHYVWIGRDGRMLAATRGTELNITTVEKLYDGDQSVEMKVDIDRQRPLMLSDHPGVKNLLQYSIILKGRIAGLPAGNVFRQEGKIIYGRLMSNWKLLRLYDVALRESFAGWNNKRFLVEVADSSALYPEKSPLSEDDWYQANSWTCDLIVPKEQADSLYRILLAELNRYTPYYGRAEMRTMPVLVLKVSDPKLLPASSGKPPLNTLRKTEKRELASQPVSALVRWLNNQVAGREVIDATGYAAPIDLQVPDDLSNALPEINRFLFGHGLRLEEEERLMECYVLSDKAR
jgi:thiol-disulfide isomerase/thioredoxin